MRASQTIRRALAAVAVTAVVGAGGAVAFAQGPWDGGPRGGLHGGRGMHGDFPAFGQLNLSDDQRQEIQRVMESHKTEREAVMTRVREARRAQQEAVEALPVDEGAIRARTAALAKAETDAALLRAKVHSAIFAVLTPDQQAKAKELRAQREQQRKERQQHRQQWREKPQQGQPAQPTP